MSFMNVIVMKKILKVFEGISCVCRVHGEIRTLFVLFVFVLFVLCATHDRHKGITTTSDNKRNDVTLSLSQDK